MNTIKSKNSIAISSIFYIMMIILFVSIVVFGISKTLEVEDTIGRQDELKLISNLKKNFKYCSDPLNSGSIKEFRIKNNKFNLIIRSDYKDLDIVINKLDFINNKLKDEFVEDLENLLETDNTIVIKVNLNFEEIADYKIITSFYYPLKKSSIIKDFSDNPYLNLKIKCE
jgi:hypothetical protein